jgi:mono/diheme cytochrome c family protein
MSAPSRPGARAATLASLAALALALACGSARRRPPLAEPGGALDAEERRGERVYMRHCQPCHPGGEAGLGPSLNDKPLPGALVKTQTRHGLGSMPAFDERKISDEELDALAAYVAALRR